MFTATINRVKQFIHEVTNEQIGICAKYFDSKGVAFYTVQSESDRIDEDGRIVAYKVTYDAKYGFRCTCPSGVHGFSNVKHPSGVCKHVRFSVACAQEEKRAMAGIVIEQALEDTDTDIFEIEEPKPTRKYQLIINGKEATDEEYDRVVNAPAKPINRTAKAPSYKAFSLYR